MMRRGGFRRSRGVGLMARAWLMLTLGLVANHAARAQAAPPTPSAQTPAPVPRANGVRVTGSNGTPMGARLGGAFAPPGQVGGPGGGPGGARREALVEQLQQRFGLIVRQRLRLTDDQAARLRQTNQRFGVQRRALNERERAVREAMRQELQPGVAANQEHLGSLIDSLIVLQRERLDVFQSEQRDEAQYLTPLQRVQYYGLQEQLRRRLEEIRRRRLQAAPGAAAPGGQVPGPGPANAPVAPTDTLSP